MFKSGRAAVAVFASLVLAISAPAYADDAADAIINKGIKALGGEAKLAKAKATSSKVKGIFISAQPIHHPGSITHSTRYNT